MSAAPISNVLSEISSPNLSIRRTRYAPGVIQPPHFHERSSISLLLQGSVEENVKDASFFAESLSLVIKPAGIIHANRYGPGGAILLQIEGIDLVETCVSWQWRPAKSCIRPFLSLAKPGIRNVDLIVRALLSELNQNEQNVRQPPVWLRNVRKQIGTSDFRLQVHRLARDLGIHRVYLTRQFRRYFGETIRDCITRLRIEAAARMLTESHRRLTDIACEIGYADQAHFCRHFRKVTGLRAREFRSLIRS